jgi:putative restriction endonuclease
MRAADEDDRLRAAAFAYLAGLRERSGGLVRRHELEAFELEGRSMPLVERQRGIRKAAGFEAAISILTTYAPRPDMRPYDDGVGPDGYPRYKWRGTDPDSFDNRALRVAMERQKPLVWFVAVAPGVFEAVYPVWLVGEEPDQTQFVVAIDEAMREQWTDAVFHHPTDLVVRRLYAEDVVKRRLHQRVFRDRVLLAYGSQCALCRLRHPELLDAAHIREDSEGGEPIVPNGVAMCAIHHRAFDSFVLGIRPDYVIEVRPDVLGEADGPTLRHALQGLHRQELVLPRQRAARPDPELLEERFERFRAAG